MKYFSTNFEVGHSIWALLVEIATVILDDKLRKSNSLIFYYLRSTYERYFVG